MTDPSRLPASDLQRLLGLFQARRFDAMEQLAGRLVQRHPDAGMAWKALGVALQSQGRDAVEAFQRAVGLLPGDVELHAGLVEAWLGRGHRLMKSSQPREAVLAYTAAREGNDAHPHAHACLGVALMALDRREAAVRSFERALRLRPDLTDTRFLLGSALLALGRPDEALPHLRRVLESTPDHANAWANLGTALKASGQVDAALWAYRRALELRPDLAANHANLGAACRDLGRMDEALACYRRVVELEPQRLDAVSDQLFIRSYLNGIAPFERRAEAARFGDLAAARARPFTRRRRTGPLAAGQRLRVGWVSADLREHPVGHFTEGLLTELATTFADRIELFVYTNADAEDALTARLRAVCRHWTSITRLDDEAAATLIHADALDVLVDLNGHTAGNRLPLFAWKPAQVQVSWLGHCATTGVGAIDHVLADRWLVPAGAEAEFTEQVWRLPETFLCFTPPTLDIPIEPLPASHRGHVTFGCFNKLAKLNDAVIATWARVLIAVPNSRLFLKSAPLGEAATREHLTGRFAVHGIGIERLIFEGASPRTDYLRAYRKIDIALDPFPYPGGTTSLEALWMGVPVLALAGASALGRQGESILQNVGLPEWIAVDLDDYVARARRFAGDLGALAGLRGGLRTRLAMSPLADATRFASHFIEALEGLTALHGIDAGLPRAESGP